jgi:hypothetical protein
VTLDAEPWAALAALWEAAAAGTRHLPGCGCGAGFLARPPRPAELEEDLIEFLHDRYVADGRAPLVVLLAARMARTDAMPFGAWLAALGGAALPQEDATQLSADLGRALESLTGSRSRFACI